MGNDATIQHHMNQFNVDEKLIQCFVTRILLIQTRENCQGPCCAVRPHEWLKTCMYVCMGNGTAAGQAPPFRNAAPPHIRRNSVYAPGFNGALFQAALS